MTTPEVFLGNPYGKPSGSVEARAASLLVLITPKERGHGFGSGCLCRVVDRRLRPVVVSQSLGDLLEVQRQAEAARLAVRVRTPPLSQVQRHRANASAGQPVAWHRPGQAVALALPPALLKASAARRPPRRSPRSSRADFELSQAEIVVTCHIRRSFADLYREEASGPTEIPFHPAWSVSTWR